MAAKMYTVVAALIGTPFGMFIMLIIIALCVVAHKTEPDNR